MRKLLLLLALLLPLAARAQISGAGNIGCSGTAVAGTAITSATANNTVVATLANFQAWGVLVQLDQTTTVTGGAVTFNYSGDGAANFVTVPVAQVLNPSTYVQLTNPYTLIASTNQGFLIILNGASNFQVKLTTAMTGTGTITPYITAICSNPNPLVLDASGNLKVNIAAQALSKVLVTPDSVALPANQSVNEAQINGVTPLMNNGVSGTGSQRINVASDNSAIANWGHGTPGSAAPAGAVQVGGTDGTNQRVPYMDPCAYNTWTYYVVNVSANTQIVAGSASKNVYVCKMYIQPVAAAANVELVESATSGNACATSPTGMMGGATAATGANIAINGGFALPADQRAWAKTATSGDAMCIFASAAVTGVIAYVQF